MRKPLTQKYPHPCVSCGVCCLATPCPRAFEAIAGAQAGQPCPALVMGENGTHCELIRRFIRLKPELESTVFEAFGVGSGCCIKARACSTDDGTVAYFSALPGNTKIALGRKLYQELIDQTNINRRTTQ